MSTVLVTGASRGIGRATAVRLAAAGWDVYAGVRRDEDGDALQAAAGERLRPIQLDITDDARVAALADVLPDRLDGLVNNAGIVVPGPLEAINPDALRRQFEVNVLAQIAVGRAVLPKLRSSRGRIVFVSSVSGRVSTPMMGAYNASKFAIEALADAWRLELRPWGVKVVLVEPSATDTDLWRDADGAIEEVMAGMSEEQRQLYEAHLRGARKAIPRMQRLARPVEPVAAAIERALTAARPRARYVVGADARAQLALHALTPTPVEDVFLGLATGTPRKA
jgi:NAD(P)-dependent dehydrogenase (short-subunit alcohol dehydrogenase family)